MHIKFSTGLKYGLAMAIIFGIALFLRIYFPYHNVFTNGWVNFQETDCYYNMRQLEILARHFPHRMLFDPYYLYPGGGAIGSPPFFYLLLGFFAWVFGAGSPTQKVIETVGAYLPAILGALVTVPVYFIGRELLNKKAGILAAALIAILPGQFLWRSMLGFPDYHVTETLFSALAMMFLIMALKSAKQKEISVKGLLKRDWGTLRRPLIYSLLAGIFLGLYLLTWSGAGLFIFIILVFGIVQYFIDHIRGRATDYIGIVGVTSLVIALVMMAISWNGFSGWNLGFAGLVIGILVFLVLGAISSLMVSRNLKKFWYPVAVIVLGGIGLALFYAADPALLHSILDKAHVIRPSAGMLTVSEVKGLSLSSAWDQFTTCFYLVLFFALPMLLYFVVKEENADRTLLFVWSIVMLVATFGQNRFSYYFAVNVAILTAYLSWPVLKFAGLRESTEVISIDEDTRNRSSEKEKGRIRQSKKSKRKKKKARRQERGVFTTRYLTARNVYISITLVVVFFLAYFPNIGVAIDRVKADTGVSSDWHESLVWMSNPENTPEPFQNPDAYYELQVRPPAGETYPYPESAYGVMSWWDYGYFISYIAHRIPNANPGGNGYVDAGLFFTAQDAASGSQILNRLGSKYVMIDADMSIGKFYAMVTWANKNVNDFYEVYYQRQQSTGELSPVQLFYPAYYQSMCSRLYNFGGGARVPDQVTVISWTEQEATDASGHRVQVKIISDVKSFTSYDQAESFVNANPGYIIVGTDAFTSPVPLEKLEHYTLIHKSPTTAVTRGNETVSYVEVFEYSP